MATQKFGLSDWNEEIKAKNAATTKKKDLFMRLQEGSNIVRILTMPHQFLAHKYKEEGDQGFGDRIMCSSPLHGQCPVCDLKDRPKRRWYVGVLDKNTGAAKLLEISVAVYKALQKFNKTPAYGDPRGYDIDINVDKEGGATGYYTVIPSPPSPLTDAEKKAAQGIDSDFLVKKCTPPTPEAVLKYFNSLREKKGKPALEWAPKPAAEGDAVATQTSAAPTPVTNGVSKSAPVDMEADTDFPPAD